MPDFLPRGECLAWDPWLIAIIVISNLMIWWGSQWIAFNILRSTWGNRTVGVRGIYWLFACLFGAAGWNAFVNTLLIWWPVYGLKVFILMALASITMATAIIYRPIADYMAALQDHLARLEADLKKLRGE